MINTAIEATIDLATHVVRPARQDREGHRRRRGADLRRSTALVVGYLVFADRLARPSDAAGDTARATRRRTLTIIALVARRHRRDRDEGDHGARDAAARRAAVRPCGARLRRLDGDHVRHATSSTGSSSPSLALIMALLVAQTRVESGHPLAARGRVRRPARYARRPDPLPGLPMTDRSSTSGRRRPPRAPTRPTRSSTSARPCSCATAAWSRASTSRTPSYPLGDVRRALRALARRRRGGPAGRHRGDRRHRLALRRLPAVARSSSASTASSSMHDGELLVRRPDELLPDSFDL